MILIWKNWIARTRVDVQAMKDLRAAAVQMECKLGDVETNTETILRWCEKSAKEGAELVCFPELCHSGHILYNSFAELSSPDIYDRLWRIAEEVPEGTFAQRMIQASKRLNTTIGTGLSEKRNNVVYNTYMLTGPRGFIGKYRKTHIPSAEYPHWTGGYELPVFDIGNAKVGISTCWDNRYPEVPLILALKGAEIIIMPHAMPYQAPLERAGSKRSFAARRKKCLTLYPCRAYDNAAFVILVDQVGKPSPKAEYPGLSMLIDPQGEIIAESKGEEEMIIADFRAEILERERSSTYYPLRTRRPELYSPISSPPNQSK